MRSITPEYLESLSQDQFNNLLMDHVKDATNEMLEKSLKEFEKCKNSSYTSEYCSSDFTPKREESLNPKFMIETFPLLWQICREKYFLDTFCYVMGDESEVDNLIHKRLQFLSISGPNTLVRHFTTAESILEFPPSVPEDYIDLILPDVNVVVIHSPGGVGKSFFTLQMALSLISGKPFLGKYAVNKRCKVLILNEEDTLSEYYRRLSAMVKDDHEVLPHLKNLKILNVDKFYKDSDTKTQLVFLPETATDYDKTSSDRSFETMLMDALDYRDNRDIEWVVLDPLTRFTADSLNDHKYVTRILNALKRISSKTGVKFILTHHDRKSKLTDQKTRQDRSNDMYGSQGISSGARHTIQLSLTTKKKLMQMGINDEEKDLGKFVTLAITKSNVGSTPPPMVMERGEDLKYTIVKGKKPKDNILEGTEFLGSLKDYLGLFINNETVTKTEFYEFTDWARRSPKTKSKKLKNFISLGFIKETGIKTLALTDEGKVYVEKMRKEGNMKKEEKDQEK